MPLTYIDTNKIPVTKQQGIGEFAEVINENLCNAKNVVATLRWLRNGEKLNAYGDTHQLVYLMDGEGSIFLKDTVHNVKKGAGFYLAPSESATIQQRGAGALKLFHLVVPKLPR